MTAPQLVDRMTRCLNRAIAVCDTILESYAQIEEEVNQDDCAELITRQQRHSRELAVLHAEVSALLHEWQTEETLGTEERETVAALAAEADARIRKVAAINNQAIAEASRRMGVLGESLATMRKGRGMLRTYRASDDHPPDYVDRDA